MTWTWLVWFLLTASLVGTMLALRAAAAAVRMAQLALAHAHQHPADAATSVVLHTGNGHVVETPEQAPDAEIDAKGEEWVKRFGPPESWGPWEEQR